MHDTEIYNCSTSHTRLQLVSKRIADTRYFSVLSRTFPQCYTEAKGHRKYSLCYMLEKLQTYQRGQIGKATSVAYNRSCELAALPSRRHIQGAIQLIRIIQMLPCICKISPRKLLRDTTQCIRRDSPFYDLPTYMGIPGEFGVILIGGLIASILYGITTLQTYLYFMHHSEGDGWTMKLAVAAIWIFESLHVSFVGHMLNYYLIVNYGVPSSLEYIVWSFPASVLANTFVLVIFQCFFTRKIYYLCRPRLRWWVIGPIILLVLIRIGFGIETLVLLFVNNAVSSASSTRFYGSVPTASADPLADVLITASLCVLLHEGGSRSVYPRTKRLVNTLIIYTVNRCLLTLPVVVAELGVAVAGKAAWSMGLNFIIGKLYANSLLATLNTRQYLRSQESSSRPRQTADVIRFAKPHKSASDEESSGNGTSHVDAHGRI